MNAAGTHNSFITGTALSKERSWKIISVTSSRRKVFVLCWLDPRLIPSGKRGPLGPKIKVYSVYSIAYQSIDMCWSISKVNIAYILKKIIYLWLTCIYWSVKGMLIYLHTSVSRGYVCFVCFVEGLCPVSRFELDMWHYPELATPRSWSSRAISVGKARARSNYLWRHGYAIESSQVRSRQANRRAGIDYVAHELCIKANAGERHVTWLPC